MIDDDYMLPVVAEHYLLEVADADRAAAFLARTAGDGETYGAALARNFAFVIDAAVPFAAQPGWQRLIELKPGQKVGNWRDSEPRPRQRPIPIRRQRGLRSGRHSQRSGALPIAAC